MKKVEGDNSVDFRIFEIADSLDDNTTTKDIHPKETTTTGNDFILRCSSQNAKPPQIEGKRLYIDIIDQNDNQPGSSKNPIPLDKNDSSGSSPPNTTKNLLDIQTHIFNIQSEESTPGSAISSSSDPISVISTDESLRDAVNSFDNFIDLDSEIFNAELEIFMEGDDKLKLKLSFIFPIFSDSFSLSPQVFPYSAVRNQRSLFLVNLVLTIIHRSHKLYYSYQTVTPLKC